MRSTNFVVLVGALACVLSACGTSTKIMNSNAQSVSIVFDGDQSTLSSVTKLATMECQKHGRLAVLRGIAEVEDGRVANFDCRAAN